MPRVVTTKGSPILAIKGQTEQKQTCILPQTHLFQVTDLLLPAVIFAICCFFSLECFGKYATVNSVNNGSTMIQYAGSEQCLLEGQEEKEQNQVIDLILHQQQVDRRMTSPASVDNGTGSSLISSTINRGQYLLKTSKIYILLCWQVFTSLAI